MSASHRFCVNMLLPHHDDDLSPGESARFDARLECHITRMDSLSLRALRADPLAWEDADDVDPLLVMLEQHEPSDPADLAEIDGWAARSRRYS